MGRLCICVYRGDGGLMDGHAWLDYSDDAGNRNTWGTWGNLQPSGLYLDVELTVEHSGGYNPKVCCCSDLTTDQDQKLRDFILPPANHEWGILNNCASFACRAWNAVGLGKLSPRNWVGIPNPNSLADSIAANCRNLGGHLV